MIFSLRFMAREAGNESILPESWRAAIKIQPLQFFAEGVSVPGSANQAFSAEVQPDPVIQSILRRVLGACLDGGRRAAFHFLAGHVHVEEGTTVGRVLVYHAPALEKPVARTVIPAGRDQRRKWFIRQRPQVQFRPGEHILVRGTQTPEIRDIQASRDVPTRSPTEFTATGGPAEPVCLPCRACINLHGHPIDLAFFKQTPTVGDAASVALQPWRR